MVVTRQDIARSGLKLLDEVGLDGLTLRLIAADLGDTGLVPPSPLRRSMDLLADVGSRFEDGPAVVLSGAQRWLGVE